MIARARASRIVIKESTKSVMGDSLAPLSDVEAAFLLVVGMSAALIQGVRGSTEDIGLWFERASD